VVVALLAAASTAVAQEPPRTEHGLRADMWTAPQRPLGELSTYVATQTWHTSYGGRDPTFTVGLTGGLNLLQWLELQAVADFSVRREAPANLSVTNTGTFFGAGPSLGFWLGCVRLHLEAEGGGFFRTLAYADGGSVSGASSRLGPAVQVGGGVGVGLFQTFGIGIGSYGRFYADRSNVLFLLEGSWYFGSR
jgi:hypothetical protein